MVPLRSNVTGGHNRCPSQLPLHRSFILFGVRQNVFVIERRRGSDWDVGGPVDRSVRMAGRGTGRWRGNWEGLEFVITRATIYVWSDELRRHRASVIISERSVTDFVEVRCALKGGIEFAPPCAE